MGLHDFVAFCRHREAPPRFVICSGWTGRLPAPVTTHVTADAFWSMVRSLVGALLAGRRAPSRNSGVVKLLTATERSSDFAVAPAHGLTLRPWTIPPDDQLASRNGRRMCAQANPGSTCSLSVDKHSSEHAHHHGSGRPACQPLNLVAVWQNTAEDAVLVVHGRIDRDRACGGVYAFGRGCQNGRHYQR